MTPYAIANAQAALAQRSMPNVSLEDMRHEAMNLCAELLVKHDPALSPLEPFLNTRIGWGLISWVRKQGRRHRLVEKRWGRRSQREPLAFEDPEGLLGRRQDIDSVRMAVALLPLQLREVIERCELGDEMLCTVADERGVHKSTITRRRQKALRVLKLELAAVAP